MSPSTCMLKGFNDPALLKYIRTGVLLGILCLTFYIRVQGVDRLPDGQFTSNDAYLYYKQAQTIAEQGILPTRDMDRWQPLGRNNGQLLSLYAYAIAYTQKFFPWWSLYQIQLYLPVLCFMLGLGVLFLFFTRCYGVMFAAIVGVLLATFPGSIERSAAGFGDRDAWCWMLGTLAVTSYLWKEQMPSGRRRYFATALAGFTCFLGGMSWEAFGIFVLMIVVVELYKFCTTDTEQHLKEYLLYLLMFVPWLYIISPAYHSGYGFAKHLLALTLAPPLAVFALRGTRYLLLKHIDSLLPHARHLSCGLTLLGIITALGYLTYQTDSLVTTTFAFHENRLMKSVTELADPTYHFWVARYGAIFGLGSIGWVFASRTLWTRSNRVETLLSLLLGLLFIVLSMTTFQKENIVHVIGTHGSDSLSLMLLALTILTLGIAAARNRTHTHDQSLCVLFLVWFLLWVSLASRGKRYDFFTGVPFAFGTAYLLWLFPQQLIQKLKSLKILNTHPKERLVTVSLTLTVFIGILIWPPLGGHLNRARYAAAEMRPPTPGHETPLKQTLTWIQNTLSEDAILAAPWDFGTQLNVFSNVQTVIDTDHYLPHWIHLYFRHVFCAQSEREALGFLKTHGATHLMLTEQDVIRNSQENSFIGSHPNNDRRFRFFPLQREKRPIGAPYRLIPKNNETPLAFMDFERINPKALAVSIKFKDSTEMDTEITDEQGKRTQAIKIKNGGVLLFFDTENQLYNAAYVPPIGWNSLAVKLFMRHEHSKVFVPVYPMDGDEDTTFKIWEIHYPPDLQTDPKYLKTGFPEIDNDLPLQ